MLLSLITAFSFLAATQAESCWRDVECSGPTQAAFSGPWEDNIFAPASRTVSPSAILSLSDASTISTYPATTTLLSNASAVVYDFGKEVGGIVTVKYSTTGAGSLGLAFTEAKNWIGLASDSSNGKFARGTGDQACDDGAIYSGFSSAGNHTYEMDLPHLRGGFRYLTLFLTRDAASTASLSINEVSLEIGFQPTWSNLRAYQGYFHSDDDELNKIWYSGAYTLQTNYVPISTGRQVPTLAMGWANSGSMANGSTVIVDGAKRDRAVWPGDMGIAVPSSFVSLGNDLDSVRNALQTMYDHQNSDGSFPEAGPPLLQQGSDTYHMWTMIGTYNYILYTNDTAFLGANWARYVCAMEYVYGKVLQPIGLLNVTGFRDWGRQATTGYTSEASMILYRTLITGSHLASWIGNITLSRAYDSRAKALVSNIMKHQYDHSYGAFRDNNTNVTLYPQDANSMALLFGVVSPSSLAAQTISKRLTKNWTPIGAETPELSGNISPFISSFEIQGHLQIGQTARGLELIRRSWGWYLHNTNGTQSTVIEGYLTNGSFGYRNYRGYAWDSSYVSHAHGWSSGPTSALTEYVLGLRIVERLGSVWKYAPQFGHLKSVEGGYTTTLGKFQASWEVSKSGRQYSLEWSVPQGTTGTVVLPAMPAGCTAIAMHNGERAGIVRKDDSLTLNVKGGKHSILVKAM